ARHGAGQSPQSHWREPAARLRVDRVAPLRRASPRSAAAARRNDPAGFARPRRSACAARVYLRRSHQENTNAPAATMTTSNTAPSDWINQVPPALPDTALFHPHRLWLRDNPEKTASRGQKVTEETAGATGLPRLRAGRLGEVRRRESSLTARG